MGDKNFNWDIFTAEDFELVSEILAGELRNPDLIIAPDGEPYLYRWHVVPRGNQGNVYLHVQVASDPERPLHDHPWDNMTTIISGGYDEIVDSERPTVTPFHRQFYNPTYGIRTLRKGDTCFRKADELHRLILPESIPYTITLFSTGPKVRDWGFQFGTKWVINTEVIEQLPDGRSIFKHPGE